MNYEFFSGLRYDNVLFSGKLKNKQTTHHQMLQRIDDEYKYDDHDFNHFQKNWFSVNLEVNISKKDYFDQNKLMNEVYC